MENEKSFQRWWFVLQLFFCYALHWLQLFVGSAIILQATKPAPEKDFSTSTSGSRADSLCYGTIIGDPGNLITGSEMKAQPVRQPVKCLHSLKKKTAKRSKCMLKFSIRQRMEHWSLKQSMLILIWVRSLSICT
jgi:hypothetical protein